MRKEGLWGNIGGIYALGFRALLFKSGNFTPMHQPCPSCLRNLPPWKSSACEAEIIADVGVAPVQLGPYSIAGTLAKQQQILIL